MVALFSFFSAFLYSESYALLLFFVFCFAHFLNEFVKPKCKTPFIKLLKGYICCIFIVYIFYSS